mmetsp:Transcript_35190/g.77447  ORF Transcript_35190/g.77447 Transcript_35190/m.77447 type:complete len:147 (-) Transcript_35190:302-742(-)
MSGTLFEEQFEVKDTSKNFDKVTRLHCRLAEEAYELALDLDVNTDLYPLEIAERFTLVLVSTLATDGSADLGTFDQSGEPSMLDQYEYAMYGKIYKWKQEHGKAPIEIHVSFGGLLMRLKGEAMHLQKLSLDSRIYLLMRKINKEL